MSDTETTINGVINSFSQIGSLSTAAVFAMVAAAEGYYIFRKEQDLKLDSERWRIMREEAVRAEVAQTELISRMTDTIAGLAAAHNILVAQVQRVVTLVEERIPRRA